MTTERLRRSLLDRILGGVCGGIGSHLGISGWWVRLAFVALLLTTGSFGLLLYVLLWLIMPAQGLADLPPLLRPDEAGPLIYARPEGMLLLGALVIIVGTTVLAKETGVLQGIGGDLLAPVTLLLIGVVVLFKHLRGAA